LSFLLRLFFEQSVCSKNLRGSVGEDNISIPNRTFYIAEVIDNRTDKSRIGIVQSGGSGALRLAQFEYGLENDLEAYLKSSLPKTDPQQVPVIMAVNRLEISEKDVATGETGLADISVDFFKDDLKLFSTHQHVEANATDVTKLHEANIRQAIAKSLFAFDESNWIAVMNGQPSSKTQIPGSSTGAYQPTEPAKQANPNYTGSTRPTPYEQPMESAAEPETDDSYSESRNVTTVGYQIGGLTLIGIDYEIRMSDHFGFHLGGGLSGFTGGLKIHTNPDKNSSYFNVCFKDGGFGLINTGAAEFGTKWVFSQSSDLGLVVQFGLAKILSIDPEFEDRIFNGNGAPPVMLSFGIGLSW